MMRTRTLWTIRPALLAAGLVLMAGLAVAAPDDKHPVFVGAQVCATCHEGASMGSQMEIWLRSAHARAYANLSLPNAKDIARMSGIPQEPQQSPICLGCHATGETAEAWELDPTFFLEDGVQCEKCHGPGSEYMEEKVMMDPVASRAAGLIMPEIMDCEGCHFVKGSHVDYHDRPALDLQEAMRRIAHPTSLDWKYSPAPVAPRADGPRAGKSEYVGVMACAACHQGPDMGYQYSKWRLSAHAQAYASLEGPRALEIAREMGVDSDPRQSESCLKCHATAWHDRAHGAAETYTVHEGVGCEACHGAGSEYLPEAIMRDPIAAMAAGLKAVSRDTCARCHENAHGKPFDYESAQEAIAHPSQLPERVERPTYKTPLGMTIAPDGREMYVACEASNTVIVIDVEKRTKIAEIAVGGQPTAVAFSPDGMRAFVTNRLDDSVSVIHVAGRKVIATLAVADEPHGLVTDQEGRRLYVLNTSSDSISVFDLKTLEEIKRLAAGRSPWDLALSPEGDRILVTSVLPHFGPFRSAPVSELTVIDTGRAVVEDRHMVSETNLMQGVEWHPSGRFALFTMNRTKNLVPMTRLMQGWTITATLGIAWRDGRIDQVLLDEPHKSFADPTDLICAPDGRYALVVSAGTDRVAVVDLEKLVDMLESADPYEREHVFPNHLGKPTEFIIKHIPTGINPRTITITADGATAFVANSLDDSITVIDMARLEAVGRIDLDGPRHIDKIRFGQRIFHSADATFQRQFTCNSCHPDGHVDGLTYDIEPDGIGLSPVDNRTLRGILDTPPFKWTGINPSLSRQCGARLAAFFTRIHPYTPEELDALDTFICTIPRPPNYYRPLGADLTDAQRRGKAMFERTHTNDGREIAKQDRCVTCHFPPYYTDRRIHDVGTQMWLDHTGLFDTPHLNNIYDSAPYLHNGISPSLEEIWTEFNPDDRHGVTNDMTKDELNDLVEFLKTL